MQTIVAAWHGRRWHLWRANPPNFTMVVMAAHGLLVARDIANMLRWASRIPLGAVVETIRALDLSATVAVCGSRPTPSPIMS